jgi:hypothetical protein
MKLHYTLIFCLCLAIAACSDGQNDASVTTNTDATAKKVATSTVKGEVPHTHIIYQVLSKSSDYNLAQLDAMYKKDVLKTAPDYNDNLKNMWFVILQQPLADKGTDAQKVFYIKEQLGLNSNLANVSGFYKLLLSVKGYTLQEKQDIALQFSDKNTKVAEGLAWNDAAAKKSKLNELVFEQRNFDRFASLQ